MIITDKIKIKVSKKNIKHLISKLYDVKLKDIVEIKTEDLNPGSHIKIKVKCDICDKEKELSFQKYIKNIKNDNFYACSSKCAQEKVKKTSIKNFGKEYYMQTEEYQKRVKETDAKIYGCHHTQNKSVKDKIKKTNLKLYGVENVFSSELIKNKIKKTNITKYGVENPSYSKEIKEKLSIINKENSNKKILENLNVLSINGDNYEMKCDCNLNHNFTIHRHLLSSRKTFKTIFCTICNPTKSNTGLQSQLKNFVDELKIDEILYNTRSIISPLEIDIYIPKLKIGIEFNGIYWHNELNKEKNYHLIKTEMCEKLGIQLIHIYEDDWIYKQNIIKSILLNKLGMNNTKIYARKCEIKEVSDNNLIRKFLETNHIQGFIGSKVKLGLYFQDKLVSLMTFGNRRVAMGKKTTNENEYELLRFCNKLNTNVIGGASKLFKYFIDKYKPLEITTYADRSFSQGKLYKTLGFDFIEKTEPNYYYVIDGIKRHRFNFRKDKLVREGFDINKTEHEIMLERGICRIYDSGNLKYIYLDKKK